MIFRIRNKSTTILALRDSQTSPVRKRENKMAEMNGISQFSAADSALGYLYQVRVALLWGLRRLKVGSDFLVSLETLDDVVFETGAARQTSCYKQSTTVVAWPTSPMRVLIFGNHSGCGSRAMPPIPFRLKPRCTFSQRLRLRTVLRLLISDRITAISMRLSKL